MNTKESSLEADLIKTRLFELLENTCPSSDFEKVKNMKTTYKLLFKILIGCPTPREGKTDQIFWDHRHFIWYLVNEQNINLTSYILHHLCEAIKESKKYKKKNVPYDKLLPELFDQGHLIYSLRDAFAYNDLEKIHGNILFALVLANMKLLKKNEVVLSEEPLRVRSSKSAYLEEIREDVEMARKEVDVVLTYEDLPEEPTDAYKPSKKRKHVASDTHKLVQKTHKKKVVQHKEIQKEIEEVVSSTVLMPTTTLSGKTPKKRSSSSITTDAHVKKRKSRKMILPSEIDEEEKKTEIPFVRKTKVMEDGPHKIVEGSIQGDHN